MGALNMKGYKILEFNDVQQDLEKYHKTGGNPGLYLGFESMEKFYSMRQDSVTDWTGLPQSGKTELMLECLYNTTAFYGWKHLLCVPDIGDAVDIMAVLIHKHTGQTFDVRYNNHIEISKAFRACAELLENFKIIHKTDSTALLSPIQFWDYAIEYKKEFGINTAVIDSWKDMFHDYKKMGTYAQYLSTVLPYRNHLSEKHKIHFHTVIHPKTPRRDAKGEYYHPQADDMEGGAQWNNSGKTIISVHRKTFDTKVADVQMLKVKPKAIGKRGFFAINFDVGVSRYYDMTNEGGGMNVYAKPKEQKQMPLTPSNDFTQSIKAEELY
jgi:hypothetical protein